MEIFKDILSLIDYGIVDNNPKNNVNERLEKVHNYVIKNNLDKILICHLTIHINTMIENLFHECNEKLKEACIELRKLILHWYDNNYVDRSDKGDENKYKHILPILKLKSSK